MFITRIVRAVDWVHLASDEGSLTLTYNAWNRFMQARGTLSLPFTIKVNDNNVTNLQGDQGVVITDAYNL